MATLNPIDKAGAIVSAVAVSALGAMFYNVLPLFLGTVQDFRGLSNGEAGVLSSSFFVAFTLVSATAFFWIRKYNWRSIAFLAVVVAIGSVILAGFSTMRSVMLLSVFLAGGAFSILYGIGTTVLGDTAQPARWFGLKIAAEAGLGVVLLAFLPGLVIANWGFGGFMTALALVALLLSPLLVLLPRQGSKAGAEILPHEVKALPRSLHMALWLGLAAILCFLLSTTIIWSFAERLASEANYGRPDTGNVLSLSLVFSMSGSLLAVFISDRFGTARMAVLAGALLLSSVFLLSRFDSLAQYTFAIMIFAFAFGLGIPYFVTVVAELDLDGRFVVLTVPAIGVGVSLAPAIAGGVSGLYGFGSVLLVSAAGAIISTILAVCALRFGLPHTVGNRD